MLDKLSEIKLLAMDVDGTLTDGSMICVGNQEAKLFNVYDGLGIRLAMSHGLKIAWVTGNNSPAVAERARALGIKDLHQGSWHKPTAIAEIAERHGLTLEEIAYVGDDLNDLPAFEFTGFAIAVCNAVEEVKLRADMVTERCGGHGAVREAIEAILKARGEWEQAKTGFLEELARNAGKEGPEAVA